MPANPNSPLMRAIAKIKRAFDPHVRWQTPAADSYGRDDLDLIMRIVSRGYDTRERVARAFAERHGYDLRVAYEAIDRGLELLQNADVLAYNDNSKLWTLSGASPTSAPAPAPHSALLFTGATLLEALQSAVATCFQRQSWRVVVEDQAVVITHETLRAVLRVMVEHQAKAPSAIGNYLTSGELRGVMRAARCLAVSRCLNLLQRAKIVRYERRPTGTDKTFGLWFVNDVRTSPCAAVAETNHRSS